MKKLGISCIALCSVGLITSTFAATDTQQQIRLLQQQTQLLQHQLATMRRQLNQLQHQPAYRVKKATSKSQLHPQLKPVTPAWVYTQGTPVTSSPYLGTHSEFDGSDLIVNISSINEDARILRDRQKLSQRLEDYGLSQPKHPLLVISGKLEPILSWTHPYVGSASSDADLGSGELEVGAELDPWVTGFMSFDYDNSPPAANVSRRRLANSRVFLNKGFVTIGNFMKSPFYATLGQQFVPFGRYSSSMITAPLTLVLGRVNGRGVLGGYQSLGDTGPYARIYTISGDSTTKTNRSLNDWGGDLGYQFSVNKVNGDIGVSMIRNIAESDGMQEPGGAIFGGFASPASSEILAHYVPGVDVHGMLSLNRWTFLAEYLTATRAFDPTNATFNNRGAKPSALNVEASYSLPWCSKPTAIALQYGLTGQALAFNVPSRRYGLVLTTSLWKDTIQSIEYRHDKNYKITDTASGTNSALINSASDNTLGKSANAITAEFGIYF
ncbi:MAG: LbtU family siderophore porin [Legionellales bacterium]|nr:LbtU family siderophore porin [Legionellales bacterium]